MNDLQALNGAISGALANYGADERGFAHERAPRLATDTDSCTRRLHGGVSILLCALFIVIVLLAPQTSRTHAQALRSPGGCGESDRCLQADTQVAVRASGKGPSEPINVRAFGAKGDGTTDDTRSIQNALDRGARTGRSVHAPAGTYVIRHLRLYSHSIIFGDGLDRTIFKAKSGLTAADRVIDNRDTADPSDDLLYEGVVLFWNSYSPTNAAAGIELHDLTVDGNWSTQTLSGAKNLWGIYLNKVTRARISNVRVRDCLNHGITLKESAFGTIVNIRAETNGRNVEAAFGGKGGGDGVCLLAASHDNEVRDSVAIGNKSIGFEDEGRFGAYLVTKRNARNRWVHLVSQDNGDHNFLALFADHGTWQDVTSIGGQTNGFNIVGTTDTRIAGLRVISPGKHGVWVRPEVYGAQGTNRNLVMEDASISHAGGMGIQIEDLQGATIQVTVRGVKGPYAVNVGLANTLPSFDVDLSVDYDGTIGAKAQSGIYAYNPTRLTIRDTTIRACSDHNVFIDGTPNSVTGLAIIGLQSSGSQGESLHVTVGALAAGSSSIASSVLAGSARSSASTVASFAKQANNIAP